MPPTTSALLPWIDQALKANGHPPVERIVRSGRRRTPPISWDRLAADLTQRTGNVAAVQGEFLRLNFGHLDPKPEPAE
jgi:hypothetical protein